MIKDTRKNRKLRRQIRKTVGALLMVSAIVVAAVPTQEVSANPFLTEKIKVAVTSTKGAIKDADVEKGYASAVPYVRDASSNTNNQVIYTSGDGLFKFAYIRDVGAVILDYDDIYNRESLTIPETLEAYRNYSENYQGQEYFCRVSISDELMGYKLYDQPLVDANGRALYRTTNKMTDGVTLDNDENVTEVLSDENGYYINYYQTRAKTDENGYVQTDDNGDIIYEQVLTRADCERMMGERIYPCYYSTRETWQNISEDELYYHPKINGVDDYDSWESVGNGNEHKGIKAVVKYIGAEKVVTQGASWVLGDVRTNPDDGVFANSEHLVNLTIEASLDGVSDYAFYNCPQLNKVEFKTGLRTLGNGAFAGCQQLREVTMPTVTAIGKDCFYNCTSLTKLKLPTKTLSHLGDCAFEGCTQLSEVDLLLYNDDGSVDTGGSAYLKYLGNHLFRGCTALTKVELPNGYFETEALDIDMFEGCTSLQYVKLPDTDSGNKIKFDSVHATDNNYPNCSFTWEEFRNTLPESFYFEGGERSEIHTIANKNSITFKYLDEQLYERVVYEHDAVKDANNADGKSARVFYQVRVDENNVGTLEKFGILEYDGETNKSHPDIISIPENFGTFGVSHIGRGSFNDNCDLVKVTIPASVTTIGEEAFRGCHNLRTVIFTDASTITSIGADAFRTQETKSTCTHTIYPSGSADKPYLYFVGSMLKEDGSDTETFKYAMSDSSTINHDDSEDIWITCHSGWPTNLEVQYYKESTADTGEAQLVGYPRYEDLSINALEWAKALPYVTTDEQAQEYHDMILNVIRYNDGWDIQLTPNEQAFLAATLYMTIPESVDCIKPGLFSGYDSDGNQVNDSSGNPITPDTKLKTITINGVNEIEPYTFKGCTGLTEAAIIGSSLIDDYVFEDCTSLSSVTLGTNLTDTGKRPFKGCTELKNINCIEPSDFTYNNGILYRNTGSGLEIVECLENRGALNGTGSYNVGPDELSNVTSIKEEAFADCDQIAQVDLSKTEVKTIPAGCFKNTSLNSITLPGTLTKINEEAFQNGGASRLVVYYKSEFVNIADDVWKNEDSTKQQQVIFQCTEGSMPDDYADEYSYINASDDEVVTEFTVIFYNLPDYPAMTNMELVDKQLVKAGEDAVPPKTNPSCKDSTLTFTGWSQYTNIQKDTSVYAIYGSPEYTVTFIDGYTGDTLKTQTVKYGQAATPPTESEIPSHDGQMFMGWNKEYYNITADTIITAIYADSSGDINRHKVTFYGDDGEELYYTYVNDGDKVLIPAAPAKDGYTFLKWVFAPSYDETVGIKADTSAYAYYELGSSTGGSGGSDGSDGSGGSNGSASASPTPTATASPTASSDSTSESKTKYTVSVSGGSGSGSYAAGDIVAINAYYRGTGQSFDKWTTSTAGVGFANEEASSTTFTMPAANVAVTATYKVGDGSTTSTTTGTTGSSTSAGTTGTTGSGTANGSSVEITKTGISNTGLAGATVSGATDNFIIKVMEDQDATNAVVTALQTRFGDISRIKYWPMDISLYDSSGRTKIADTSGISVNITLPIPDDLVQYAGNNKVAAVSGGVLEDLNTRFTTVDGVPCVNFTATHFSPYVIYVDTANLSEGTIDITPKTGDGIHPKWFLSLGMACVALVLFFKRDKAVIPARTA